MVGRVMFGWSAALLVAVLTLAGCRSCSDGHGRDGDAGGISGPTMPTGMLVPSDAPSAATPGAPSLRLARDVKSGPYVELQTSRPGDRADRLDFQHWRDDSQFVPLEAMTLLHEPFARALPGFDLFLPRLYSPEELVRLAAELDGFAKSSQGEIAMTARELATFARAVAEKGSGLWVITV